MRFLTPVLACLLALAAAGRFHAEASARDARADLQETRAALAATRGEEARLRLEVEVLESAGRFEEVNARTLRLAAPEPGQLTTAEEFAERLGEEGARAPMPAADVIGSAITMNAPDAAEAPRGR